MKPSRAVGERGVVRAERDRGDGAARRQVAGEDVGLDLVLVGHEAELGHLLAQRDEDLHRRVLGADEGEVVDRLRAGDPRPVVVGPGDADGLPRLVAGSQGIDHGVHDVAVAVDLDVDRRDLAERRSVPAEERAVAGGREEHQVLEPERGAGHPLAAGQRGRAGGRVVVGVEADADQRVVALDQGLEHDGDRERAAGAVPSCSWIRSAVFAGWGGAG